jgi:IMP dehydrogenase/GMP reductase
VVDREAAADPAEAVAFEVELERGLSSLLVVAERVRLGRVLAAARPALKALRPRAVEAGFNLPLGTAAMRTLMHVKRYSIICADVGNPFVTFREPGFSTRIIN